MSNLRLRRIGLSQYETPDGRYEVARLYSEGYGWSWFITDQVGREGLEPCDTLAEAREALAAEYR